MKKSKSILSLLLAVILIVGLGFTVITGIGKSKSGAMKNIKLGLDLAGGVSITYQVKDKHPTKQTAKACRTVQYRSKCIPGRK